MLLKLQVITEKTLPILYIACMWAVRRITVKTEAIRSKTRLFRVFDNFHIHYRFKDVF